MRWIAVCLASLCLAPRVAGRDEPLASETVEKVVTSLAKCLEENYVFPEVGKQLADCLKQRLWDGAYENVDLATLALRITGDLRSVNHDRHLVAEPIRRDPKANPTPEEEQRREADEARRRNHGFRKLEILDGNIGYLALDGFAPAESAGDTAVAAMGFLAHVDALIIDLRANGGGEPSMIQLLCSYFFAQPTLLNTFQWRGHERIDQFWTLPHVPGTRLVDVPLYVLTASRTFSAAEEFTYDLKNLKRATIVGERTGGGAHPGEVHDIEGLLRVFVPQGRAINPITGTDWEGKGIEPDLAVPAENALDAALRAAREALKSRTR